MGVKLQITGRSEVKPQNEDCYLSQISQITIVGAMIVGAVIVGAMIVGAMIVGAMIVGTMIVGTMIVGTMIVGAMRLSRWNYKVIFATLASSGYDQSFWFQWDDI